MIEVTKLLAIFLSGVYNGISVTLGSFMRKFTIFLYCPSFLHFAVFKAFPYPIDTLTKFCSHGMYTV